MKLIRTLVIACIFLMGKCVWAESNPIPQLEQTANSIIATLKQNKAN